MPVPRVLVPRRMLPVAVAVLFATWAPLASAASPEDEAGQTSSAPASIPDAQIVPTARQVLEFVERARATAGNERRLAEIEAAIPELDADVAALEVRLPGDLSTMPTRSLQREAQSWGRARSRVRSLESGLETQVDQLSLISLELSEKARAWQATRDRAAEEGLPGPMLGLIDSVTGALGLAEREAEARFTRVLEVQGRVTGLSRRLETGIERLNASLEHTGRWFVRDSGPVWRDPFGGPPGLILGEIGRELGGYPQALSEFWRTSHTAILAQLACAMVLLLLLYSLAGSVRRWPEDADRDLLPARVVLARPPVAALLLLLVSSLVLYPNASTLVRETFAVLFLVPFLVFLPHLTGPDLWRMLRWLTLLFMLDRIENLVSTASPRLQILQLLVSLTALVLLLAARRRQHVREGSGFRARAFRIATLFGTGALGVGSVAIVLGYVSFGVLLRDAFLSSLYLATALLLVGYILAGLWAVLLRTPPLKSLPSVRRHGPLMQRRLRKLLRVGLWTSWFVGSLGFLHLWAPAVRAWNSLLDHEWTFGAVEISLGGVVAFALTLVVAAQISRLVRFSLEEDLLPAAHLPPGVPHNISLGVHYTILGLGFFLAMGAAGVELSKLTLLAGALGVGLGFGLQTVVNNLASGLILIFERPIQVQDIVLIGDLEGRVLRIGLRSSTVRTFDGADVVIPNGNLVARELVNWTRSDRLRRVEVKVGTEYGSDPERVVSILVDTVRGHPHVIASPEPFAILRGFGDSALDFSLFFWTQNLERWWVTRSEITTKVHRALGEAGIVIPFPQRDVHLLAETPAAGPEPIRPPLPRRE